MDLGLRDKVVLVRNSNADFRPGGTLSMKKGLAVLIAVQLVWLTP
jgi:hypothetical protein